MIRRNRGRVVFCGLALAAVTLIFILYGQLGHGTIMTIHETLFDNNHDLHLEFDSRRDFGDEAIGLNIGLKRHDTHDHKKEVGFVLHESVLGAPEFIGRNQKQALYIGDGGIDDPETYLNAQNFGDESFNNVEYKDNQIAVGCALTLRDQTHFDRDSLIKELPFFKGLLLSFCATATRGFGYHFYIAHDHTDPFFETEGSHKLFTSLFYEMVARKCSRRLNVTLHFVECQHSGHPAWAQNDAMMAAYMDNMDYYYRVNDDTIMETTGWTEKFIDELGRFNPPNVGVVGPWFREGNIVILTHDFVHRTHVDVFGFYYPRVFTDWFADDWITGVYWPERSRKVPGTRVKHTMEKGQRYVAHYDKASRIKVEVEIGKAVLGRYIDRKKGVLGSSWDKEMGNVISMSLYGNDVNLLYGSLRYSQLVPILFPKWRLRVYVAGNGTESRMLKILVKKMENSGVEVVRLRNKTSSRLPPSLWKYLIADDTSVKRFVVRDAMMRPSEREAAALEDWLQHEAPFYCIRDHPTHATQPLVSGLTGGMPLLLRNTTGISLRKLMKGYKSEADFLRNSLWPRVKAFTFSHDSVSCTQWPGSHPFPVLRQENEFVGQHYDANDQPVDSDDILFWNHTYLQPECVFVKNTGFDEETVRSVIRHQPVFWSQDYHVTPMMDIRSLLSSIGVKVIDNSLSYYCGKVGTCARNLKIINSDNGMRLSPELIDQFYRFYKDDPTMKSVTAFICTLPVAMCEAFVPFNKSMVIIATIRYEQARPEPDKWNALNRLLVNVSQHRTSVLAANNLYDAKYIEYFTGLKPLILPNYCAYLTDSYKPTRKQFLVSPIHSSELYDILFAEFDNIILKRKLNLVIFPLREMYPQYLYSDLASHRGIIHIPYQVSMVSLTEQYRMNIPLFFPSLDLLTKWHVKYQVVRQRTWNGYMMRQSSKSGIPGLFSKVPDPNNDMDEDAVHYWLNFADFYQWPHVIYFDSVDDLVDKMMTVDLDEISRRMRQFNDQVRHSIKATWSKVLLKLTEGRPISNT